MLCAGDVVPSDHENLLSSLQNAAGFIGFDDFYFKKVGGMFVVFILRGASAAIPYKYCSLASLNRIFCKKQVVKNDHL